MSTFFKQVHEYQKRKKLNRLKSIKLKRSKVNFIRKIHRYNEAKSYIAPLKVGFEMASELRRGGVFVKFVTVRGKVKAAHSSLKREMMNGRVDSLILVSDDSVFSKILRKVWGVKVETVVVVGVGIWGGMLICGFLGFLLRMEMLNI